MLQKQNIPINFGQGIDTKTDQKQVLPGKLLLLQNGQFISTGKLRKRFGNEALSQSLTSGGAIAAGALLGSFQSELVEGDGLQLYSYAASTNEWTPKGALISFEIDQLSIIKNGYQQTEVDSAQHPNGLRLFTWNDSRGTFRYSVVDSVTDQSIVADKALPATASLVKPMVIGAYLLIFYIDTSSHNLRMISIQANNPTISFSPIDVATDVNVSNPVYDIAPTPTRLFISYNNSSMGGGISTKYVSEFLVISASFVEAGEVASTSLACFFDTVLSQVWVAYYNGTAVKYFILNFALSAVVLAPTSIETIANIVRVVGYASNGVGQVWYEIATVADYNEYTHTAHLTNAGVVTGVGLFIGSVGLAFKPFNNAGITYVGLTHSSVEQPEYFIARYDGAVVGKLAPSNGGGLLLVNLVPETVPIGDSEFLTSTLLKDLLTTIGGTVYTQTGAVAYVFNFESNNQYYKTVMGSNFHVTGGMLWAYDGEVIVEQNFHIYPENISPAQTASGPLSNGQYQYSVTYEWTDFQGQIHRSNPSTPITVTVTSSADNQVTLTIPTLMVTAKQNVQVVVYRTEANGTIFYQATSVSSPLFNDPTMFVVTFVDTVSDATLIGNPILYTTGGVVNNFAPPAPLLITIFKDRLIIVPAESPNSIWFSKEVVPGSPVEFSDQFIQNIDQRGGPITGIEQLDDKLILFKLAESFYMVGDGPDNTGAQNDFTQAQLITTDSGCNNAKSIVLMPVGVMYQSEKGWYTLGRNLGVTYTGAAVEAFNGQTTTSSILIPKNRQVRFTLADGDTLTYDYFVEQWAVYTNFNAMDSTVFENEFTFVQNSGLVLQEDESLYTDNNQFIKMKATTSWLSMAGLQGFQRAYRCLFIGDYISPHQLLISVSYDFDPSIQQQDYINTVNIFPITDYGQDSPYGSEVQYGGQYPQYQFRIDLQRQTCQAIQFTIEDVQGEDFGEGFNLSALNLMVGVKQGSNKIPSTRVFG